MDHGSRPTLSRPQHHVQNKSAQPISSSSSLRYLLPIHHCSDQTQVLSSESPMTVDGPRILFDAVYAAAVLHHLGTLKLKHSVERCLGDVMTAPKIKCIALDDTAAAAQRTLKRCRVHQQRSEAHSGRDYFDILRFLEYITLESWTLRLKRRHRKRGRWSRRAGES